VLCSGYCNYIFSSSDLDNAEVRSPAERHAAMTWAQRLKRVFSIDIEVCGRCGGSVRVVACIEDQDIIDKILAHLRDKELTSPAAPLLLPRAWHHHPEHRLRHCLFSPGRNPLFHNSISKDATENLLDWTAACCRSGMVTTHPIKV